MWVIGADMEAKEYYYNLDIPAHSSGYRWRRKGLEAVGKRKLRSLTKNPHARSAIFFECIGGCRPVNVRGN